jgi:hypothetical protein
MMQGDSESIRTQKAMLTQYAKEHGFMVVEIYVDDGWSGLNFDRPDFNRISIFKIIARMNSPLHITYILILSQKKSMDMD